VNSLIASKGFVVQAKFLELRFIFVERYSATLEQRLFGFFFRSYNRSLIFYVESGNDADQASDDTDSFIAPLKTPYNSYPNTALGPVSQAAASRSL
jgi:hypothetical protein